ncbi:MAG: hypothetical protein PF447_06230 [Spirochaetaceae bacterium]|nr:hypothetical protein [Spirochaetaceae bacterium]
MGLFTPLWKHKDENKRIKWVEKSDLETPENKEIIRQLIKIENLHVMTRITAKLKDKDILSQIAESNQFYEIRNQAYIRLDEENSIKALLNTIRMAPDNRLKIAALDKIEDQELLLRVAKMPIDQEIGMEALERIKDQALITEYFLSSYRTNPLKYFVVRLIKDQEVLAGIVKDQDDQNLSNAAIEGIRDLRILEKLRTLVPDKYVLATINDKILALKMKHIESCSDQDELMKEALTSEFSEIRQTAIQKLNDQLILGRIATEDPDDTLRSLAMSRINDQDLLADIFKNQTNHEIRKAALINLTNLDILLEIEKTVHDTKLNEFIQRRLSAVKIVHAGTITDQVILADYALNGNDIDLRMEALSNLTDQKILRGIAKNDMAEQVRFAAAEKLTDKSIFNKLKNDRDELKRRIAKEQKRNAYMLEKMQSCDICHKGGDYYCSACNLGICKSCSKIASSDLAGDDRACPRCGKIIGRELMDRWN